MTVLLCFAHADMTKSMHLRMSEMTETDVHGSVVSDRQVSSLSSPGWLVKVNSLTD